jgi:tetratricopeptide (TPR) repeat protein
LHRLHRLLVPFALLLAIGRATGCARKAQGRPIEFIEDDYPRALAEARSRGVPLFVDAWAPWCHTCLSMRAYVFPDPALRPFASRLVWLSLDTERAGNAPVVEKLAIHVLPTMFIIQPRGETTTATWTGSRTAPELAKLLGDTLDARPGDPAEAVDALVTGLADAKQSSKCARSAADAAPSMPPGTPLADVVRSGIECATSLARRTVSFAAAPRADDGGPNAASDDAALLTKLTTLGERIAGDRSQPILADDRSDLFDHVEGGWDTLQRPEDARRVANAWALFLEEEAGRAPSPAARAVFDAHRLAAYIALGDPARALPMLEQSARDFPDDYNPPARMGRALLALHRPDDAIAALERALRLAYGPRKLTLWSLEADAYIAKGDRDGARRALESALAFASSVPLTGGYENLRASLAKRLAELQGQRGSP